MATSHDKQGEWADSQRWSFKPPNRWHVLPHEVVFALFLGAVWLRLGAVVGFAHSSTLIYGLYLLSLIMVVAWTQARPSPYRWRVRMLLTLAVSALSYFSLTTAVPLMHNPYGLDLAWHQDTVLSQWDVALFGDLPRALMASQPAAWVTDLFMGCYLFFFYYLVGGLLFYFITNLEKFRVCLVGFCTLYALGYVSYVLLPAAGPVAEMGARTGGWLTNVGGSVIAQRTNGVDVFPSIHMAASLFLLLFDWEHRRNHFWWVLAPVVGLWISTVFLRYHYGIDLVAGIVLALGCVWLARWFSQSQLCAEVEAECAAHGKQAVAAPESSESSDSKESA